MICPKCKAEYRDGFTVCADCDVKLVGELPAPKVSGRAVAGDTAREEFGSAEPGNTGDLDGEDPFCAFWQGEDSRVHAELCAVLEEAGIPVKTVRREDHLFRLSATSALKIGVPFSMYEKAESAVMEAFRTDEGEMESMRLLKAPKEEKDDEEDDEPEAVARAGANFDPETFAPEDATAEIWHGADRYLAEFLANSMATNEIHCRWDKEGEQQRLLVLPGDAERGREIVREVADAAPPEE
jgi:hypothetical protein